MKIIERPVPVPLRGNRLEVELGNALRSVVGVSVSQGEDGTAAPVLLIHCADDKADEATVDAVLAAHDGNPTQDELAEQAALKTTRLTRLEADLAEIAAKP